MPHINPRSPNRYSAFNTTFALAIGTLLISFVTVFRGSNRYVPLILVEWVGVVLFLTLGFRTFQRSSSFALKAAGLRSIALFVVASAPLWVGGLQLILVPKAHSIYILSSTLVGVAISVMFVFALTCESRTELKPLLHAWKAAAIFQACVGVAQLTGHLGLQFGADPLPYSTGTFANRNHFANFLAMSIPLVILELKPEAKQPSRTRGSWLWLCSLFLLVAAILASESRAGLVTAVLSGILAATIVFASSTKRSLLSHWAIWLVPAFVMLALVVGGMDWLYRFEWDALSDSALERAQNREATWQGALTHLPWGSGLGTFANAFAAHQPPGYGYWLDYAHSDFLQLFFETGVFAWLLSGLTLALCIHRFLNIARAMRMPNSTLSNANRLSLVALCGVLALLIHAWVDFPARIPANAMLGAFLLGVFLREPSGGPAQVTKSKINGLHQ